MKHELMKNDNNMYENVNLKEITSHKFVDYFSLQSKEKRHRKMEMPNFKPQVLALQ